ncbi:MAG: ArsC family transcriptional regulator [Clostridiales bacterium]|nr:ArsC family transcriptional regulator [Clostridiales bacterium]MCF8023604.1 ArsC family transcriptional regulator [Clostridiales bacterium]
MLRLALRRNGLYRSTSTQSVKQESVDIFLFTEERELESVKAAVGITNLINTKAKEYKKLNMDRIVSSKIREEILLNHPELYKTPIVRNGKLATVGYQPEIWNKWE